MRRKFRADEDALEMQVRLCKAFAHPTRLRILDLVSDGECALGEVQAALGNSGSNLSQHLAVLKSVGVVSTRREGKVVYCSLALPEVKEACQRIRQVLRAQLSKRPRLDV
jgi:ArsR family transcriptional regulator